MRLRSDFWVDVLAGGLIAAIMVLVVFFLAVGLSGCTIVEVRTDGGKPELSAWLAGVRVGRGDADAVSVNSQTIGVAISSTGALWTVGAGYSRNSAMAVDRTTCGIAIIERPAKAERGPLAAISDQSRAYCARQSEGEP